MMLNSRWMMITLLLLTLFPLACLYPVKSPQAATSAKPVLVVKPTQLNFIMDAGLSYTSTQTITISNAGDGQLDWSMSDNAPWIILQPVTVDDNTTGNIVRVNLNTSGLAAGEYTGFINILADKALNSPVYLPVYLYIAPVKDAPRPSPSVPVPVTGSKMPSEASVVWQNHVTYEKYAQVNACIVTGSVSNADRLWYLEDVSIIARSGRFVTIAQSIPPGETVMYSRYIPCYQYEEVNLKYTWRKP